MIPPLFPAFRSRLAALGRRTLHGLRQTTLRQLGQQMRELIPDHWLASADEGANRRDRDDPLRLTVECLVWQMLNPGTACRGVVRQVQALCRLAGRPPVDDNTSASVPARQRLPQDRLPQVLAATAPAADRRAGRAGPRQGRPVKVADGSTTQLPDTPKNQKDYPQPSGQKPGCGFPVMKLAGLFSLASGALLDVIMGNLHAHDLRLFRQLWDGLQRGDIALGDRA